ncbi:hypothetical protein G4Y73_01985 [Wenzhouxiangella sp. XN201]|uniref:hypothetical protein n=1 Tax=Wenzhouxiangella sp. XN201 TaxID=2710755 RepID=UPI0013C90665|nr:hypothetical protein [Wenzhouxiangella sp. XN201]NEZ02916.1 hypothetical protein [Wenzhouxiangella sp. XN201]
MVRPLHLIAAIMLAVFALPALASQPLLIYERTHAQVAHEDNTFRLVLFDDDFVELHFPFYSPQAGDYRWQVSSAEREALLNLAAPIAGVDARSLVELESRQGTLEHAVVTDADPVTIELNDASRGSNRVTAPSPEIWARNLPDGHEMAAVADIARHLADWMREHVRELQP